MSLGLAGLLTACGESPERPKNLLVLSVDTLRTDAVGAYGSTWSETPHFDQLANRGVIFTEALTPIPRTTPAFGSLLTGLWPHHHGSREVGDPVRHGTTLAEVLQARGFATWAVTANAAAGPDQLLDRGFDHFVSFEQLKAKYGASMDTYAFRIPEGSVGRAEAVTREAIALLDQAPADPPFFLWVLYLDPHFLYYPPGAWTKPKGSDPCLALYAHYTVHMEQAGQVFSDVGGVASQALDACRHWYAGEVAYTDHWAGVLLEALEARGRLDETLVIFVSDHGENLGEGGLYYEHGNNVHHAALRVPLVLAGPGIEGGRAIHEPVSLADVFPTLLSLLDVPREERPLHDGLDLSKRIETRDAANRRQRSRPIFAEAGSAFWHEAVDRLVTGRAGGKACVHDRPWSLCRSPEGSWTLYDHVADPALLDDVASEHPQVVARLAEGLTRWPPEEARPRAVTLGRFKLVQSPRFDGGFEGRLYDLETDPAESRDVSSDHPEMATLLEELLARWADTLDVPPTPERSSEIEETLRSLGYLQ